jgi:hypothetical protein
LLPLAHCQKYGEKPTFSFLSQLPLISTNDFANILTLQLLLTIVWLFKNMLKWTCAAFEAKLANDVCVVGLWNPRRHEQVGARWADYEHLN